MYIEGSRGEWGQELRKPFMKRFTLTSLQSEERTVLRTASTVGIVKFEKSIATRIFILNINRVMGREARKARKGQLTSSASPASNDSLHERSGHPSKTNPSLTFQGKEIRKRYIQDFAFNLTFVGRTEAQVRSYSVLAVLAPLSPFWAPFLAAPGV
jgi:hypothetical protein